jgi:hypothetical protein
MNNIINNTYIPGVAKDEKDWEELNDLGSKLGLPVPQTFLKIDLKNPGEEEKTVWNDRSRSFVRNFYNALYSLFIPTTAGAIVGYEEGKLGIRRFNGTIETISNSSGPSQPSYTQTFTMGGFTNARSNSAIGIVVGSSNTAESFEDFRLSNLILHTPDTGAPNCLLYNAQVPNESTRNTLTNTWSVVQSRIFNNNSGGDITIRETGIYAFTRTSIALILRDALSTDITVLNGGQLTVSYTWSIQLPEA